MSNPLLFFVFVLLYLLEGNTEVIQEHAKIIYVNPKYFENAQCFTSRKSRKDSYKTNITGTLLHTWDNNVTIKLNVFYNSKGILTDIPFVFKLCDLFKLEWVVDFMTAYSNIKPKCPLLPGKYGFYNMELPPSKFPYRIPKGDGVVETHWYITATQELMGTLRIKVHIK